MTRPTDLGRAMAEIRREIRREQTALAAETKAAKGRIAALEKRAANLDAVALGEIGAQEVIPGSEGDGE